MEKLNIKKLMYIEHLEEYKEMQKFRQTFMGKLIDRTRYKNEIKICLTPNGFINSIEKYNNLRDRILDLTMNKK